MSKRRFYVTMTWEDWPEGGSFGTIVEADDHDEAERLCIAEMLDCRASEIASDAEDDTDEGYAEALNRFREDYVDQWHVVDCFDLDEFIKRHTKPREARDEK